jgi:hypothetical protein
MALRERDMIRVLLAGEDTSHHIACTRLFDRVVAWSVSGGDESDDSA